MSRSNVLAAPMTAAFLAAVPAQLCAAETPAPLLACAAEADDARRLACFDRVVAQMRDSADASAAARAPAAAGRPAPAGAPPVPAPGAAPAANSAAPAAAAVAPAAPSVASPSTPSRSPEEDFGLRQERELSTKLTGLDANAATISTRPHGELVVALDNGQVWAEIAPGSKIKLKPGDPVRIQAGTLGSFILIAPNGRSSKVKRVR